MSGLSPLSPSGTPKSTSLPSGETMQTPTDGAPVPKESSSPRKPEAQPDMASPQVRAQRESNEPKLTSGTTAQPVVPQELLESKQSTHGSTSDRDLVAQVNAKKAAARSLSWKHDLPEIVTHGRLILMPWPGLRNMTGPARETMKSEFRELVEMMADQNDGLEPDLVEAVYRRFDRVALHNGSSDQLNVAIAELQQERFVRDTHYDMLWEARIAEVRDEGHECVHPFVYAPLPDAPGGAAFQLMMENCAAYFGSRPLTIAVAKACVDFVQECVDRSAYERHELQESEQTGHVPGPLERVWRLSAASLAHLVDPRGQLDSPTRGFRAVTVPHASQPYPPDTFLSRRDEEPELFEGLDENFTPEIDTKNDPVWSKNREGLDAWLKQQEGS